MAEEKLRYVISVEGEAQAKAKMRQARESIDKESKGIVSSFKGIAGAAKAFIGAYVVQEIGRAVVSMANMAEQSRVVGTSFRRLAASINQDSSAILNAMQRGIGGAVSNLELMKKANQAILLGIPLTAGGIEELAAVSLKLSRAMGIDVNFALESMVTGIGRQSKLWLDNLGIIVDAEGEYKKMAASMGKTAEQLTDTEKKLAFYNATMEAARSKSKELGEVQAGLGEKWSQTTARIENAMARLGEAIAPGLNRAIGLLNQILDLYESVDERATRMARGAPARDDGGAAIPDPITGVIRFVSANRDVKFGTRPIIQQLRPKKEARSLIEQIDAMTVGAPFRNGNYLDSKMRPRGAVIAPSTSYRFSGMQENTSVSTSARKELRAQMELDELNSTVAQMDEEFLRTTQNIVHMSKGAINDTIDSVARDVKNQKKLEDMFRKGPQAMEDKFSESLRNIEINARSAGLNLGGAFGSLMNFSVGVQNTRQVLTPDPKNPGFFDKMGAQLTNTFKNDSFLGKISDGALKFARSVEQFAVVGSTMAAGVGLFVTGVQKMNEFFNPRDVSDFSADELVQKLISLQQTPGALDKYVREMDQVNSGWALTEINAFLSVLRQRVREQLDTGFIDQQQANQLFSSFAGVESIDAFKTRQILPASATIPEAFSTILGNVGTSGSQTFSSVNRVTEVQADLLTSQLGTMIAVANVHSDYFRQMTSHLSNMDFNMALITARSTTRSNLGVFAGQ